MCACGLVFCSLLQSNQSLSVLGIYRCSSHRIINAIVIAHIENCRQRLPCNLIYPTRDIPNQTPQCTHHVSRRDFRRLWRAAVSTSSGPWTKINQDSVSARADVKLLLSFVFCGGWRVAESSRVRIFGELDPFPFWTLLYREGILTFHTRWRFTYWWPCCWRLSILLDTDVPLNFPLPFQGCSVLQSFLSGYNGRTLQTVASYSSRLIKQCVLLLCGGLG